MEAEEGVGFLRLELQVAITSDTGDGSQLRLSKNSNLHSLLLSRLSAPIIYSSVAGNTTFPWFNYQRF